MNKLVRVTAISVAAFLALTAGVKAQQLVVDVNRITSSGVGKKIGTVGISETKGGVTFQVLVKGLPSGQRGFYVHENRDCGPAMKGKKQAGLAAGYDPQKRKSHKGPKSAGRKGNLPALTSTSEVIDQTVIGARLRFADIRGRSLIIHEGGDNYSDQPENAGGKGRIACAVIPQ